MNFNNDNKYDFSTRRELINGNIMENLFSDILISNEIKFEVKSEIKDKWISGNIYVEYEQYLNDRWVPSGISVSEADYFVYVMKDNDFNFEVPILLPMVWFKKRIKYLLKEGYATLSGKPWTDSGTATKAVLVPFRYLYTTPTEIEGYKKDKQLAQKRKLKKYMEKLAG